MLPVQFHLHELCHFVHTLKNNNKDHETANIEKKTVSHFIYFFLLLTMRWPLAFAGASRGELTTAWMTVAISFL